MQCKTLEPVRSQVLENARSHVSFIFALWTGRREGGKYSAIHEVVEGMRVEKKGAGRRVGRQDERGVLREDVVLKDQID